MNGRQASHMRTPFKQRNISSTSLEGMERPVRSFRAFVQTAPPNPTETDKALPTLPINSESWNQLSDTIKPTTPLEGIVHTAAGKPSGMASWRAPAEWYNDSPSVSGKSTPSVTPSLPSPATTPRGFSPLLPEPSPGALGIVEPTAWLFPGSPLTGQLLPIYEGGASDLSSPGRPPNTPLPATPPPKPLSKDKKLPPPHRRTHSSPSRRKAHTHVRVQALSRAGSNASRKEKAFASLGLDSPPSSDQEGRTRADQGYLRGKKLRALYKGSPLVDDSWEDEDMDDKTRELSYSQDYHDLLADQYQEMSVRKEEVLNSGGLQQVYEQQVYEAQFVESMQKIPPKDRDIVPRPLSWRKSPVPSSRRSHSHEGDRENIESAGQKSRHRRLSSFMPHHRSGGHEVKKAETPPRERRFSKTKRTNSDSDNAHNDELRISKFFSSSLPLRFGRKTQNKIAAAKAPTTSASPSPPSHLIRLPGGLALVRTRSPSSIVKSDIFKSDIVSDKSPISTYTRRSSLYGSDCSRTTSDPRSSCNSQQSPSSTSTVPIAMRSAYRTSRGSLYSDRSTTGQQPARDAPIPPPPPPAIGRFSPPLSPFLSQETLDSSRSHDEYVAGDHGYLPNLIEKARQARKRRVMEARQDKLKRSIKVLGPTDPGIAQAGYVRSKSRYERNGGEREVRLPGYMVRGPAA